MLFCVASRPRVDRTSHSQKNTRCFEISQLRRISARTRSPVAPDGLPSNNGSLTQPLDLVTALSSQGPVRPGDTVWLRGGVYRRVAAPAANGNTGLYVSTLDRTAGA